MSRGLLFGKILNTYFGRLFTRAKRRGESMLRNILIKWDTATKFYNFLIKRVHKYQVLLRFFMDVDSIMIAL